LELGILAQADLLPTLTPGADGGNWMYYIIPFHKAQGSVLVMTWMSASGLAR